MTEILSALQGQLAWPAALVIAWLSGELVHRWLGLPRISAYGLAGFLMAFGQGGFLPRADGGAIALLADFAFALMLFELGYRINLSWLKANPWLGISSVVESAATFAAVYLVAGMFSVPPVSCLLLSSLAMATSPAAVLRVVNELKSSGQVTERALHYCAFNCVFALVAFKAVVAYWVFSSAGGVFHALWNSLAVMLVSAGLGVLFGVALAALLHSLGKAAENATLAFALAVLLLTTLNRTFNFSPLLAALSFGLVARHRRIALSPAQRNFGTLGDLLAVVLFVFVASALQWMRVVEGIWLALAVFAVRMLAKVGATTLFARPSGISWRKAALSGLALMPMSVFAILLLEQTRYLQLPVLEDIAGITALVLMLEVIGPVITQWALIRAGETTVGRKE